ncbi:DUF1120 domain-containing protein [Pseudomonas putida]|uniref:DUF1120 domain-containing protein n=1 Tax=Pseudomonas putida TaxID=303 RepID=UPI003D99C0E8
MIKNYFAALTAAALISVAPFALAASSVDLTVTGTITPNACTPSLSAGGLVEIGKISAKDLSPTTYTMVTDTPMDLTVDCDAPMLFAINSIDNKPGTAADGINFGVGMTQAGQRIGVYAPVILTVTADGVSSGAIESIDNGASWIRAVSLASNKITSASEVGGLVPIAAQNLVMGLSLKTWIAPADGLDLTDDVTIDGSATFEMKYL